MRPSSLIGVPTGVVSKAEHSSGAKKAGDPSVFRRARSSVMPTRPPTGLAALERASASDTCETPKSEILAVRLSCVHRRFAGLMSRWMIPLKCTVTDESVNIVPRPQRVFTYGIPIREQRHGRRVVFHQLSLRVRHWLSIRLDRRAYIPELQIQTITVSPSDIERVELSRIDKTYP